MTNIDHLESAMLKLGGQSLGKRQSKRVVLDCEEANALREYFEEQNEELARAHEDSISLCWMENFLQRPDSCVCTECCLESVNKEDLTDEGFFVRPFQIGYRVELEHRGCYKWVSLSGKKRRLREAIKEAREKQNKAQHDQQASD